MPKVTDRYVQESQKGKALYDYVMRNYLKEQKVVGNKLYWRGITERSTQPPEMLARVFDIGWFSSVFGYAVSYAFGGIKAFDYKAYKEFSEEILLGHSSSVGNNIGGYVFGIKFTKNLNIFDFYSDVDVMKLLTRLKELYPRNIPDDYAVSLVHRVAVGSLRTGDWINIEQEPMNPNDDPDGDFQVNLKFFGLSRRIILDAIKELGYDGIHNYERRAMNSTIGLFLPMTEHFREIVYETRLDESKRMIVSKRVK